MNVKTLGSTLCDAILSASRRAETASPWLACLSVVGIEKSGKRRIS
jgi:hypothetical protein